MALRHNRDGYTFCAAAAGLMIEPSPKPITLTRQELAQLGLQRREDYSIPIEQGGDRGDVTDGIPSALDEAIRRCRGPFLTGNARTGDSDE